ncbi:MULTISPECIES: maleylpyruvate isomerase family mycothiol-dependent enzyme [unclassified Streptomyces]|uniref:maleylpyruvate isomerase family mycothiol-dependent enzyme n=1 Tax=unclassified Streptomyces TaxID=2593676 RepID=UPI0008890FBF|nr:MULTISPECIES: maleylpyruvate isomerase family mycothiol-dependent enzyme [unclassified Streptomyces]PBC81781.1 maleylpyruvate isomerase [Streptomyces sp. 2321.6]SDR53154.1 maleylpyruvate isomerase [Streptomyces sp. KS_16]SEC30328.1 maleylpyruvate isomerase [Streptomyces sp. 2133.1]SNC66482.1 maleylpyruvate isomerase [Streptomyces sp. 2114.4]
MTLTPPDFPHDVAAVREATDRLLVSVSTLDDAAIGEPSLLPGWTRGHVLAHLARNADALGNLLTWARTDVPTPMYAGPEARAADIERGADRPLAAHLDDLRESAARFDKAMDALPRDRRAYQVEMRNNVVERADRLPLRRLAELELHHVDLGVGHTLDQLSPDFVERQLAFLATVKFAGHPELPPLELRSDDGRRWHTGRLATGPGAGDRPVVVTGSAVALVGWLTGRGESGKLDSHGSVLPVVPPL